MVAGMVLLEVFASPFARLFGLSGETEALCISAMRIISLSFIFAGLNVSLQGVFQALDGGLESLVISVCRQLLLVLPVAWGFSLLAVRLADMSWTVWLTFPIAETVSAAVAIVFLRRIYKRTISAIND